MTRPADPEAADPRDPALAALYRQAARDEPSRRHDAAILAAAAIELAAHPDAPARPSAPALLHPLGPLRPSRWRRWRAGLAVTATLLLSAGLVLLVQREHSAKEQPAATTGHTAPVRQEGAPVSPPLGRDAAAEAPQAPAEARRAASAEAPAAATAIAPAAPAAPPRPPGPWLAEIRALRQAGREEEARAALQAFRRAHPAHPLPADLRSPEGQP